MTRSAPDIPEEERLTWNLEQLDEYAAMLSKKINQQWKPIIKK